MKTLKLFITGLALTTTIVAAGLVQAQADVTVTFDVDSVTELNTCSGPLNIGEFTSVHQGKESPTCNIVAYSNDPDGFTIDLYGTDEGLEDTTNTYEWDKLDTSTGDMDTSCTSNCTQAWGFRIVTGTASEYNTVNDDANNGVNAFDASTCGTGTDKCWHTVNYQNFGPTGYVGAETIITNNGPSDKTANFDIEIGAVLDFIANGTYADTITLTITPQ